MTSGEPAARANERMASSGIVHPSQLRRSTDAVEITIVRIPTVEKERKGPLIPVAIIEGSRTYTVHFITPRSSPTSPVHWRPSGVHTRLCKKGLQIGKWISKKGWTCMSCHGCFPRSIAPTTGTLARNDWKPWVRCPTRGCRRKTRAAIEGR